MKNDKKAKFYLLIGVLTLITLAIGATYAYFQAQAGENTGANINVATNTTDLLQFKIDKGILIHANQTNFSQGKGSLSDTSTASALLRANNKTNSATGRYNIYFVIETNDFIYTSPDNSAELLLNVTDPTGKRVENITGLINTGAGFDITTRTGGFLIVADYDIASNSSTQATKQDWKVEVTLVNLDSDQSANAGKSLSGKIYVTKEQLSSYELAQISKMTTTTTYDSISTTAEVTPGSAEVKKYYFASEEVTTPTASVDNGVRRLANTNSKLTYVESTTPNYKFTNLKENSTYKIYSYVEDANGIKSNVYETEIKTDTYVIPKVNSVSHASTLNSISLTVSASKGSNNIVSYLYSKDNGASYEESPNNTYTFNNLNDTTEYKIKVKVKDSLGRYSTEYYEAISTTTYILPVVTNVKTTTTYNSITLNVTGTNGTNTIAKYKYSINNGPYQESTNATYTFNGLNEKTNYPIKVVAVDTNNRESVVYTTTATTDAYKLPTINNVTLSSTANSITLNVSGTNGDGVIKEYYYSKDDGSSYTKSNSASHTFNGLTGNTTFYVKVYVKDSNGKQSSVWSGNISTKSVLLADYIVNNFYVEDGKNSLYLHDGIGTYSNANLESTDKSYRFSGPNPNNYLCLGTNTSPCPADNLYRIIGIFDGNVKVIKNLGYSNVTFGGAPVQTYATANNSKNYILPTANFVPEICDGSENIWDSTSLDNYFKNKYPKIMNYILSDSVLANSCVGDGYNVNRLYECEKNKTNKLGKVGLMHISDYVFAAMPDFWNVSFKYGTSVEFNEQNNWLFTGLYEWTITSVDSCSAYFITKGDIGHNFPSENRYIRPSFYLNSNVTYASGSGTQNDPIIIN